MLQQRDQRDLDRFAVAGIAVDDRDLIDSEACAWLVRIEENGLDHHGQAEFDAWLAADPRHEATYAEMRETWADIPELCDLAELVPVETAKADPYPDPQTDAATEFRP